MKLWLNHSRICLSPLTQSVMDRDKYRHIIFSVYTLH